MHVAGLSKGEVRMCGVLAALGLQEQPYCRWCGKCGLCVANVQLAIVEAGVRADLKASTVADSVLHRQKVELDGKGLCAIEG